MCPLFCSFFPPSVYHPQTVLTYTPLPDGAAPVDALLAAADEAVGATPPFRSDSPLAALRAVLEVD